MQFSWPLAATVLGVFALILFRKPLTQLLERTEKVKDWLVAPKQTSQQAAPKTEVVEDQSQIAELTKGFDSQVLLAQEESIRADLGKYGLKASGDCERILVRHLAGAQVALHFEKITRMIYGSQVEALRWLNGRTAAVHASSLHPHFDGAKQRFPWLYEQYGFREWLGFLAQYQLITESAESDGTPETEDPFGLQITVLGREYLKYLLDRGLPEPAVG